MLLLPVYRLSIAHSTEQHAIKLWSIASSAQQCLENPTCRGSKMFFASSLVHAIHQSCDRQSNQPTNMSTNMSDHASIYTSVFALHVSARCNRANTCRFVRTGSSTHLRRLTFYSPEKRHQSHRKFPEALSLELKSSENVDLLECSWAIYTPQPWPTAVKPACTAVARAFSRAYRRSPRSGGGGGLSLT